MQQRGQTVTLVKDAIAALGRKLTGDMLQAFVVAMKASFNAERGNAQEEGGLVPIGGQRKRARRA